MDGAKSSRRKTSWPVRPWRSGIGVIDRGSPDFGRGWKVLNYRARLRASFLELKCTHAEVERIRAAPDLLSAIRIRGGASTLRPGVGIGVPGARPGAELRTVI